jgi:hypothetical protein
MCAIGDLRDFIQKKTTRQIDLVIVVVLKRNLRLHVWHMPSFSCCWEPWWAMHNLTFRALAAVRKLAP